MTLLKVLAIPAIVIAVGVIYWFLSYDPAGTAMLLIFGVAMGLMSWVLVPTFGDVGPTAPVDPDWHERGS
jgi:ABC-type Fe3+ transport system permease subunit